MVELEKGGLQGVASSFAPDRLVLNGAGEFAIGGPVGDNGLSGKKLVIDHYGPGVPIGGGALCGKDAHKVDKCGALRARQLAKRLVRNGADEARVILGWAPGGDAPFLIEASTIQGSVNLQVPRRELPPEEWFRIEAIVRDLELTERDWATDLRAGYFCQPGVPWSVERIRRNVRGCLRHFSNIVRFRISLDDDRNWAAKIYQERAHSIDADRNVTYFF
jgi:S-adenosylmethionine synthetase